MCLRSLQRVLPATLSLGVMLAGLTRLEGSMGNAHDNATGDAAQNLRALFAREWDYEMQLDPVRASSMGDRRWNDRWSEETLEHFARNHQHDQEVLAHSRPSTTPSQLRREWDWKLQRGAIVSAKKMDLRTLISAFI